MVALQQDSRFSATAPWRHWSHIALRRVRIAASLLLAVSPLCAPLHTSTAQGVDLEAPTPATEAPQREVSDPLDPFDLSGIAPLFNSGDDAQKSAQELLEEAELLLATNHLLDARTKLLRALQKDPKDYRTYQLLAGYYTVHVGHFRLAFKYIKRAEELFEQQHGRPPYRTSLQQREHSTLIFSLSQIRLNLDNYRGALETLDRYTELGYYNDSIPGSRAWILMKLGDIKEAIRVARTGIMFSAEPGSNLNMLGILLSMNEQPHEAIDVLKKAIAHELSLGEQGQASTPLNNIGEVYREIFDEGKAESSFLRAINRPDGCEHVLPALNLALMYIEQMKFSAAVSTMDSFAQCIAQFPLRNSEEHAALVSLARARIDLHTGHLDRAITRLESALEGTQWFGKIGTSQTDLLVAATISLAQALDRKGALLATRLPASITERLSLIKTRATVRLRSWWMFRRARQILASELNDFEDLRVRNADSLLEYPTLGETLAGFSSANIARRLAAQRQRDTRAPAQLFYDAYEAEGLAASWRARESRALFDEVIQRARPTLDELVKAHALLRRMKSLDQHSDSYRKAAYSVFERGPAELRNYGFLLPIAVAAAPTDVQSALASGPFLITTESQNVCTVRVTPPEGGAQYRAKFECAWNPGATRSAQGSDPAQLVNALADAVFTQDVGNGK